MTALGDILVGALGSGLWSAIDRTRIAVGRRLAAGAYHRAGIEAIPILHQHRIQFGSLLEQALSQGGEVLLLSIMSQHTVEEIRGFLMKRAHSLRQLRILTIHPSIEASVAQAIGRHLKEVDLDKTVQIQSAWQRWKSLEAEYQFIEVRGYRSIPMAGAVWVVGQWMSVELLPYGCQTRERPAMFFTPESTPEIIKLYGNSLDALWRDSVR